MDAYPPEYVDHNLPFIVLSGLGHGKELSGPAPVQDVLPGRAVTTVNTDAPLVTSDRANNLLHEFLNADGSNSPWNGQASSRKGTLPSFKIRAVGRVG